MPSEITNSLRSSSIIRVIDAGTYTANLVDLSANSSIETISSASIKRIMWSTSGSVAVARNESTILSLSGTGDMKFSEIGHSLSANSTYPIVVTITTGGTALIEVTKQATYNPALVGY